MRAVVDSNVVVSALIRPAGTEGVLWQRACEGAFTIVFSIDLVEEITSALMHPKIRAKYGTHPKDIESIAGLFTLHGEIVKPEERIILCRDPDDDFILEIAVTGQADYIVSGDKDLLTLKKIQKTKIVKPAAFLSRLDKSRR
jgi:uncharacterized protein